MYRSVIRAKALDTLRGLLPAATTSNVGLFGTGQAYEALLLRMFANPLLEVRACAHMMLGELRQVIPAFLSRVDQPNRGVRWSSTWPTRAMGSTVPSSQSSSVRGADISAASIDDDVRLTDFDPEGETKVVAAALYSVSAAPDATAAWRSRARLTAE